MADFDFLDGFDADGDWGFTDFLPYCAARLLAGCASDTFDQTSFQPLSVLLSIEPVLDTIFNCVGGNNVICFFRINSSISEIDIKSVYSSFVFLL